MTTEDDALGGLEAVLAATLAEVGLPEEAGLTGLLRHLELQRLYGDRVLAEHIKVLQSQLADFVAGVRTMMADGTIVELVAAARRIGALEDLREPKRSITPDVLDSFVTGAGEAAQYDLDARFVPKAGRLAEEETDYDGGPPV